MKVVNLTRNTLLAEKIIVASSLFARIKGLLGRKSLNENEALVITSCNSIHTFFMRFVIDVLFLDKHSKVVALKEALVPFRITPIYSQAFLVVELPSHTISRTNTQVNDQIQVEK